MDNVLIICDLNLYKNEKVMLKNLSLDIKSGQRWGVLGPNGVGKTSLLQTLAGLNQPQQGQILFNNRAIPAFSFLERARILSFLPQEPEFNFSEKVIDILKLALYSQDIRNTDDLETIIDQFSLIHFLYKDIQALSSGERKRVALAMIKLQNAEIVILDEPTNHLDIKYQVSLVTNLSSFKNITLFSTHDLNLVEQFCTHVLVLFPNGDWQAGMKEEIMSEHLLSSLYQQNLIEARKETRKLWGLA